MAANANVPAVGDWNQYKVSLPLPIRSYLEYWHYWYNLIVHRGVQVRPYIMAPYVLRSVSKEVRPAPFPLNIEETWYCGFLILLIVASHIGADKEWLLERIYPHAQWVGRVAGRVLLTLGAAVLSTCSFEIVGSLLNTRFTAASAWIRQRVSNILVRDTELRTFLNEISSDTAIMIFDFLVFSVVNTGKGLIKPCLEKIISPVLSFFFSIPVHVVPTVLSWLFLPTPELDTIQDLRTLWFEYGVPIVIQFWLTVLLWLILLLFIFKAERLGLQGWRVVDPKMVLVWQLIRATSMHLVAYTAYQLVCGILAGIRLEFSSRYPSFFGNYPSTLLNKVIPDGNIGAAVLLLFAHSLLRSAGYLAVRLSRPFWIPYILWQTQFSQFGVERNWPAFVAFFPTDFGAPQAKKRVNSRVLMTALFGLKSSWPVRMNLSPVVPDE